MPTQTCSVDHVSNVVNLAVVLKIASVKSLNGVVFEVLMPVEVVLRVVEMTDSVHLAPPAGEQLIPSAFVQAKGKAIGDAITLAQLEHVLSLPGLLKRLGYLDDKTVFS